MAQVMLIADDLTGALDAGVCLLPADVLVATSPSGADRARLDSCPAALSVNAGTRHLNAPDAAARVGELVGLARRAGVPCVVKKTDSALRGNVGAELAAAWRASGLERLHFIPALPEMGRVTRGGIHYVDGVPVSQSRFGSDPFEPVVSSNVAELVSSQTSVPVTVVPEGEAVPRDARGIVVYDATTPDGMAARVRELLEADELRLVAGCSGVARALAKALDLGGGGIEARSDEGNLLVVCGSVNRTSRDQCAYAARHGASVLPLGREEKCSDSWIGSAQGRDFVRRASSSWASRSLTVIDGSGMEDLTGLVPPGSDVRQVVADHIGALLVGICEQGVRGRVLVTGGDILASFLSLARVGCVRPLAQPMPGIVRFEFEIYGQRLAISSKSGGFGRRELFVDMSRASKEPVKECCING